LLFMFFRVVFNHHYYSYLSNNLIMLSVSFFS
jgi:hypothetical protein